MLKELLAAPYLIDLWNTDQYRDAVPQKFWKTQARVIDQSAGS